MWGPFPGRQREGEFSGVECADVKGVGCGAFPGVGGSGWRVGTSGLRVTESTPSENLFSTNSVEDAEFCMYTRWKEKQKRVEELLQFI